MRIKQIGLPSNHRFACSRRQVKAAFAPGALDWVSFGDPIRTFMFDHRASRIPQLSGFVVASASVNRDESAYLCLFPISRSSYPDTAASDFSARVLPSMARWIMELHSRPSTAVVGVEQSVVEWTGATHEVHKLTFL
ncbi:MAG: hypothetical protein H6838_11190 [Planctomycetes bacterium]|nr:hypothetical protein [Planctomycetota bacterium]